jgi:Zn-finger nucleic acid-binding protein
VTAQEGQFESGNVSSNAAKIEVCPSCGGSFTQKGYLDHLFLKKECMRKYWEEEEKNHISRLRHRTSRSIVH